MIRPLELLIGLRYTRAKKRTHFISFISLTSMLGITLGVWALITVMSIMNGFERELRDRILATASHITVYGPGGTIADWRSVAERVDRSPQVLDSAPFISAQGMLTNRGQVTGVMVRGILPDEERQVSRLLEEMIAGSPEDLVAGEWGIILGYQLANQLAVGVGDKVTLVAPEGRVTPAGLLPRLKRFTVTGLFRLNMYEYDSSIALIHIDDAATLLNTSGQVSGLRVKVDDVYDVARVRYALEDLLGGAFRLLDWTIEHRNFFGALAVEKRVMFIILMLIIAVAAFNIVSTLVMLVTDKQPDIAILRTLGFSPASVMAVFMIQGIVIGVIGTVLGGIAGVATALNVETLVPALESMLGIEFFPANIYVISEFPAELQWEDVWRILGASMLMSLVATIYPAWRASRTQPAEALRYE
ncbi:MAG: lipoprotein-releasing ABC transporter permease subunit [Proteobacteria bacterium]|nr:MAG: lipoprotein-releasing ABC transporter permease subunit [Pseudomonadota bacterium]